MNFDEFYKKYIGKSIDFDGVSGVQCVDLVKQYLKDCYNIKAGAWGNARDYWLNFENIKPLKDNFIKILNTPDFVPQKSDIVVWSGDISNSNNYGHIAIATGVGNTHQFYTIDQNWNGKPCKEVLHNYYAVYGVLRPKKKEKTYKTVKANGGLNAYISLLPLVKFTTIPDNSKVEIIDLNYSTAKIKGKVYKIAKIKYKYKVLYVANKWLK